MADFSLTIIGSGSALPMHGRHPSAQVLQHEDFYCLIDCGEGTQDRLQLAGIKAFKINMILISHLHGDHVFGLPGLLSSYTHLKRTTELIVHGPVGLKGLLDEIIHYTALKISYPLQIIEHQPKGLISIFKMNNLEILTFPLFHRISCNGYLIREIKTSIRLRKDSVQELDLSPDQLQQLQEGKDIVYQDRIIENQVLAYPPAPAVSYAYCSDTRFEKKLLSSIKGVSVLYHETTFMNDKILLAEQTGHSTSGQAGVMAAEAGVNCLITGHYSSRYKDIRPLVEEANVSFPHVLEAEEGKKYNIRNLARGLKE